MLNRKKQPEFNTLKKISFQKAEEIILSNGVPLYIINAGEQDVVKIDFMFDAGSVMSENPLIPLSVNSLIDKGTSSKSSLEIAEKIDFYGAYLDLNTGKHIAQITLYTLNKYFEDTLSLLSDLIYNAIFPSKETEIWKQNKYQEFLISRQKTEILSNEKFLKLLFGDEHPYAKSVDHQSFENFNNKEIITFFNNYYSLHSLKIILAGKVNEKQIKLIDKHFGNSSLKTESVLKDIEYKVSDNNLIDDVMKLEDSIQSSIRIGKITLNKKHPDYFNLNITSILLGGYFGSRLMRNIREDKGYTYGIYSSNMSLLHAGIFTISAESGKEVYRAAIEEVMKELKLLRTEPVADKELRVVKNWIMGSLTKLFDGPFALSDAYRSILNFDLGYDYYDRYFKAIQLIDSETIMKTAEKYLHEESMKKVIVGSI
jgi:zinc protease